MSAATTDLAWGIGPAEAVARVKAKRVLYREAALEAWLGTGDTSPAGAQS